MKWIRNRKRRDDREGFDFGKLIVGILALVAGCFALTNAMHFIIIAGIAFLIIVTVLLTLMPRGK